MLFTALTALTALAALPAAAAADPSSFSCAISTQTLHAGEAASTVCSYSQSAGWVSLQWMTGTFGRLGDGLDNVLISLYLDGEATPALSYFPYELSGIPSLEAWNATPRGNAWSGALFARYSATSFTNTMPIPFATGLRITLQYMGATQCVIYYQAHGIFSAATRPQFGGLPLPAGARLVMQRNALTLPRLAYLAVSNFSAGTSGIVAAIAIAFTAPNLNTLEGCFHFYDTASTPYPGQLHSTGTEDEFISSYYFDLGVYQGKSSGIFYKVESAGGAAISMYRTYESDPMLFSDGGLFVWRNGDTTDPATGIKCMVQSGGSPAGNPQAANVQTTSFNYVW